MGMNETPSSERVQIGFFGRRNAGKSSVINRLTGQSLTIVSDIPGTTTDPVRKAMEIHGLGPCVVIDTAGIDDEGELGKLRVEKTKSVMDRVDVAVLVTGDGRVTEEEQQMLAHFKEHRIPVILCFNRQDVGVPENMPEGSVLVSAKTGYGFDELTDRIKAVASAKIKTAGILDGLITEGDMFILVIPMDAEAPKGRIILPQQMVLHEILLHHAGAVVCQPEELAAAIRRNPDTRLVITDSQAFYRIKDIVPEEMPLTSFSILLARYRGSLHSAVDAAKVIDKLADGDRVLISEGCTHRRTCGDIGSIKIPALLRKYTGRELTVDLTSGSSFAEKLAPYRLVIHCGACVLNDKEMQERRRAAAAAGVPMTNYGIAAAYMRGILWRSIRCLPEYRDMTEEEWKKRQEKL